MKIIFYKKIVYISILTINNDFCFNVELHKIFYIDNKIKKYLALKWFKMFNVNIWTTYEIGNFHFFSSFHLFYFFFKSSVKSSINCIISFYSCRMRIYLFIFFWRMLSNYTLNKTDRFVLQSVQKNILSETKHMFLITLFVLY